MKSRVQWLTLGSRTVLSRPKLFVAAWLLHMTFALLAAAPALRVFSDSLAHRPAFSNEILHDFSLDLLTDWRAAYGQPLRAYLNFAFILGVIYGVAKILLDAVMFPAYLHPFDDVRSKHPRRAIVGILSASLLGLGLSITLYAALSPLATRWPAASVIPAIVLGIALAFLRVLTNLWKCAAVTDDASFGDALRAVRARPWGALWITLATLAGGALFLAASAGTVWYAMGSSHVWLMLILQQAVILAGVWLRLWLTAACVVLWRVNRLE